MARAAGQRDASRAARRRRSRVGSSSAELTRVANAACKRVESRHRPAVIQCRMNAQLPSLFVSHGSPMIAPEPGAAGAFMQRLGPALDAAFGRPKAIVTVSAHTAA